MSSENEQKDVAVATAKPAPKTRRKPGPLPLWHVILLDDDDHTFEYVIEMLRVVFGYPDEQGYLFAREVHESGRVIVLTTHRERAEFKRDQIHAYGADTRVATCKGSMSAKIEEAPV